jgi:hypothetical protein
MRVAINSFRLALCVYALVLTLASDCAAQGKSVQQSTLPQSTNKAARDVTISNVPKQTLSGQHTRMVVATIYLPGTCLFRLKMPEAEHLAILADQEKRYQATVEQDIRDGLNAEVRDREQALSKKAELLHEGQTTDEVVRLLGTPHMVKHVEMADHGALIERVASVDAVGAGSGMELSYWPRVGVPFDGRNGQGYKVLFLYLDREHTLKLWSLAQPYPFYGKGTLTDRIRFRPYWEGSFTNSPAPP